VTDLQEDLAARYALARSECPDDDIKEIVALIAERMGIDGETALATARVAAGGDVDVIRQFVYDMEDPHDSDGDDD
jgi:hypothetical protein